MLRENPTHHSWNTGNHKLSSSIAKRSGKYKPASNIVMKSSEE
jgi:hypothetical protein